MKTNSFCVVVVFFLSIISCFSSATGELSIQEKMQHFYNMKKNEFFENEKSMYENVTVAKGLYYIYVFGQSLPIPSRFVLLTQENKNHQFNSMPLASSVSIEGVIKVGRLKDINGELIDKQDSLRENYVDSRTGLSVRVYDIKIQSSRLGKEIVMDEVIISNEAQYISVFDDNQELWKLILSKLKPIEVR